MSPNLPQDEWCCPENFTTIPPSVERWELWQEYMDEEESNSDISDTEEEDSMAGPSPAPKTTKAEAPQAKSKSTNDLTREVLDDCFNNMIYKILNGASAEDAAAPVKDVKASMQNQSKPQTEKPNETSAADEKTSEVQTCLFSLKENSSSTSASEDASTKAKAGANQPSSEQSSVSSLPICPDCSLPRLQYARIGLNSRPAPDPTASYCANEPAVVLAGHDVHGNAFPGYKPKHQNVTATASGPGAGSKTTKKTKDKAAAKSAKGIGPDNPPSPPGSSQDSNGSEPGTRTTTPLVANANDKNNSSTNNNNNTNTNTNTNTNDKNNNNNGSSNAVAEYPSIKTPQVKCPNHCGQWKAANLMAKHLDACMLGKGRKAGREAREKMGRDAGGDSSRATTPKPGNGGSGVGITGGNGSGGGAGSKRKLDTEGGEKVGKKAKKVK